MKLNDFIEKIYSNWQAKLLSFGLAVLIYAAFQIISLDTRAFTVPLEVRAGGNYVLTETPPDMVRVELRGKPEDIATIQDTQIVAFIDISHIAKSGVETINVGLELAENLVLMSDLEVSVSPYSVSLNFEENSFAWVAVEPSFIGSPVDGYEVLSWTSSVSDVKIMGAKSIVDSTKIVYADGISLNERTESFRIDSELVTVSDKVQIADVNSTSVFVEIIPQIITVVYENVAPFAESLIETLATSEPIPLVTFEISGEKIPLDVYVPDENVIEIDFSQITDVGEYTLPVITNIPAGFTLNSINLTEVTVTIIEAPTETEIITSEPGTVPLVNESSAIIQENTEANVEESE